MENLNEALEKFEQAKSTLNDFPNAGFLAQVNAFIGEIYFLEGNHQQALSILRDTLPDLRAAKNKVAAMRLIKHIRVNISTNEST